MLLNINDVGVDYGACGREDVVRISSAEFTVHLMQRISYSMRRLLAVKMTGVSCKGQCYACSVENVRMVIRKSIVVSFLPYLTAFLEIHPYMFFSFSKMFTFVIVQVFCNFDVCSDKICFLKVVPKRCLHCNL